MTIPVDFEIIKANFISCIDEEFEPDVRYDPEFDMYAYSFKHGNGRIESYDMAWVLNKYNNPQEC